MTDDKGGLSLHGGIPHWLEVPVAAIALVVLFLPLLSLVLLIKLTSSGPGLFRQTRVGRNGRLFRLFKLRTMRSPAPSVAQSTGSESGAHEASTAEVTAAGDPRITTVGRFLRRTKLDELPQLWNVVRGDLALVGPRPEVPRYVDLQDPLWRQVLAVRPGITDPATIELRHEEEVLVGLAPAPEDQERAYREVILPKKLKTSAAYLARRSFGSDLEVLWRTALALGRRSD